VPQTSTSAAPEVVARAVQVGRHGADEVGAVLAPIGLAQLDPGDLGHRVPLIARLQLALEQARLGHRLRREPRVDAARAEEQELLHPDLSGGLDHVRRDHQVVVNELGGPGGIRENAADPGGGDHDDLGPRLGHPALDLDLPAQITRLTRDRQDLAALALEPPHQSAADHAPMARDPQPFARQHQRHRPLPSRAIPDEANPLRLAPSPAHREKLLYLS
jgi:hypothetical protein